MCPTRWPRSNRVLQGECTSKDFGKWERRRSAALGRSEIRSPCPDCYSCSPGYSTPPSLSRDSPIAVSTGSPTECRSQCQLWFERLRINRPPSSQHSERWQSSGESPESLDFLDSPQRKKLYP